MRVDALAIRLRPRTPFEAADLGVRLCQSAARSVFGCHAVVALPIGALALASHEIAGWLPYLVVWWTKPWIDRTILFVLARAAFGQQTTPVDVWRAQREVWWRQLLFTFTERRLSPWRGLTQPVYQLEGVSALRAQPRVAQVRRKTRGPAALVTIAYSLAELSLTLALFSLIFWLAPFQESFDLLDVFSGDFSGGTILTFAIAYVAAALFLEPFFVASGFAMYLNRRAELEAWDIEQEFRRAFAS
ncbi:MAG TPA: hypothetical protein VFV95_12890 [Vicinamibacterales bacterium]|nr:hypothetical protein [Vicinamibacterales bacterium]